jgi:hypothetical protein
MRKIFIRLVAATVTVIMLLCGSTLTSSAAGEMAYNLYTGPDMSKTGKVHKTYMIDFRAPESTYGTYWALANFGMEINRDTQKKYRNIKLGGGYAGMQYYSARNCETDRVGILSFWHWEYRPNLQSDWIELEAERIYPYGPQVHFGGEGTGTQSIQDYAWVDNQWYTMVLHTWEDVDNQSTFAGEWILDQKTGVWTLVTYYDTKMIKSGWTGDMGLFMENFMSSRREGRRAFNVKGMYVLDRDTLEWSSINKATISYGNGGTANKVGTHEYGATEEYFWGLSDGTMRDDQAEHDAAWPEKKTFTINQPEKPTFTALALPEITLTRTDKTGVEVSWTTPDTSAPHVGFKVEILDEAGKVVTSKELTRPELKTLTIQENLPAEYNCRVTVTDIFGQTVTAEKATEGFNSATEPSKPSETPATPSAPVASPSAPSTPSAGQQGEGNDGSSFDPTPVIIVAVVAVAVAVVAVGGAVLLKKKKKS